MPDESGVDGMCQKTNISTRTSRRQRSGHASTVLPVVLLILSATVAAGSQPTDSTIVMAREKFEAGKYEEAASLLQAALVQEPRNSSLAFWLMRNHYELDRIDEAIRWAERAVQLEPSNSEFHQWLGRAYGRKAEKTRSFSYARKTRAEFETAVSLNPANLSGRRDLMEFYLDAPWILGGGKDKGWRQAEAIAALDAVEGCLAHGSYWQAVGKAKSAEAEYAKALDSRPARLEPYFEIADFYQAREDAARLEATLDAAARVNPRDLRLNFYRGVACILARKRLAEGEQLLKTYLATAPKRRDFPSPASAHVSLGRLDEQLGKSALAAEQYQAALALDPGNKDAREGWRRTSKTR